ncbi:hypothetical protein CHELA20_51861 [Hyphomicrobiales bacterium]|nr:hypothetical protein CHELA41_23151 [Hyphomicrobiales bacterium]CAH1679024.1 hypothetical protein CHELA20_51861 [Hyphomicrobiales bacterium]
MPAICESRAGAIGNRAHGVSIPRYAAHGPQGLPGSDGLCSKHPQPGHPHAPLDHVSLTYFTIDRASLAQIRHTGLAHTRASGVDELDA